MSVSGRNLIIDEIGEPVLIELSAKPRIVRRFIVTQFFKASDFKDLAKRLQDRSGLVHAAGEKLEKDLGRALGEKLVAELRGQIGYQTVVSKGEAGRDLVVLLGIVPFELSPGSIAVTWQVTRIDDPPPHP